MTHKEKARQLIGQQYHCAQAVLGAFADDVGLDLETALKISSPFGSGMRLADTCGCFTASLMVIGMMSGRYDVQDQDLEIYGNRQTEEFGQRFLERMNGCLHCRDILGKDLTKLDEMAEIRRQGLIWEKCPNVVFTCVEILDDMLEQFFKDKENSEIELENIPRDEEMRSVVRRISKLHRFQRNVRNLLLTASHEVGFIQFDIRKFKIINDLYGEKFGDEILGFVIEQLREVCRDDQYYINLRSDVFMVVTEYEKEAELEEFIAALEARVCQYKDVKLQMCYGIYTVEDRNMELRQMEDRAAMARKAVKVNLVTNILFYNEQFKDSLYNRKFIEENMQEAISDRQFMMYLQPKYSIMRNKIVGAEALVRWRHPTRGMIYPDQFIPIIEENGFVQKVDYYIWAEACRFIRRCQEDGIAPCPISVNVSRVHLRDNECIGVLSDLIKSYSIPKRLLELEITETVDDQQLSQRAMQLKDEGFTLLMDDFGSGYSSLNILLETPFDVVKLDKRFIENMMLSDKGKLILEQVVHMSEKLDLGLLAEGVETKEQVELLQSIGCDHVQGYYYAKPMPEDEFFALLREQQKN